jgi:hypothetical protein
VLVFALIVALNGVSGHPSGLPPFEYRFADFPAVVQDLSAPTQPVIRGRRARLFRTQLRRAALQPANFAGHMRLAEWGCGTCCTQFGIVDLQSGYVFMPDFFVACGYPSDEPIKGQAGLYYQPDSALLVVVGSCNEGPQSGIYYYRWNGRALHLLKASHETSNE